MSMLNFDHGPHFVCRYQSNPMPFIHRFHRSGNRCIHITFSLFTHRHLWFLLVGKGKEYHRRAQTPKIRPSVCNSDQNWIDWCQSGPPEQGRACLTLFSCESDSHSMVYFTHVFIGTLLLEICIIIYI